MNCSPSSRQLKKYKFFGDIDSERSRPIMQNMIFVLYPLFCILLPCMLYVLIQTKGFHQRTNFIHMIWVFIFLYYVYLVLETTGIGTIWESVYISVCQVPPQLPQIL